MDGMDIATRVSASRPWLTSTSSYVNAVVSTLPFAVARRNRTLDKASYRSSSMTRPPADCTRRNRPSASYRHSVVPVFDDVDTRTRPSESYMSDVLRGSGVVFVNVGWPSGSYVYSII